MNRTYKLYDDTNDIIYTEHVEDITDYGRAMMKRNNGDADATAIDMFIRTSTPSGDPTGYAVSVLSYKDN